MEDGLGGGMIDVFKTYYEGVLILVLVEDGLGAYSTYPPGIIPGRVLILVLVEDGLGDQYIWQ